MTNYLVGKQVNELKWKVLHLHACFMLKPIFACFQYGTVYDPYRLLQLRVCVRACVCQNDDE